MSVNPAHYWERGLPLGNPLPTGRKIVSPAYSPNRARKRS